MSRVRELAERALIAATARPGPRTQALNRALFQASLRGLGYCGSWRVDRSGEGWFLRNVIGREVAHRYGGVRGSILDVGANRGDYSRAALQHAGGVVHAFEPQAACWPDLYALRDQYGPAAFVVHETAVGARRGTATIRFGEAGSEWASLATDLPDFAERAVTHRTSVPVVTLDECVDVWERIHLLKIDVEGWEVEVLQGARALLGDRLCRPRWVQVEWNLHQLARGHTMHRLLDLLPGYQPHVLLLRGLRPLDPDRPEDNVFSYANLIFKAGE